MTEGRPVYRYLLKIAEDDYVAFNVEDTPLTSGLKLALNRENGQSIYFMIESIDGLALFKGNGKNDLASPLHVRVITKEEYDATVH